MFAASQMRNPMPVISRPVLHASERIEDTYIYSLPDCADTEEQRVD